MGGSILPGHMWCDHGLCDSLACCRPISHTLFDEGNYMETLPRAHVQHLTFQSSYLPFHIASILVNMPSIMATTGHHRPPQSLTRTFTHTCISHREKSNNMMMYWLTGSLQMRTLIQSRLALLDPRFTIYMEALLLMLFAVATANCRS